MLERGLPGIADGSPRRPASPARTLAPVPDDPGHVSAERSVVTPHPDRAHANVMGHRREDTPL